MGPHLQRAEYRKDASIYSIYAYAESVSCLLAKTFQKEVYVTIVVLILLVYCSKQTLKSLEQSYSNLILYLVQIEAEH